MSIEPKKGKAAIKDEIDNAAAGLVALIDQLQSGQLRLLFAKAGDADWSDGAEQMIRYYQQLLTLFQALQTKRAGRLEARQRRKDRRKKKVGAKKARGANA